VFYVFLYTGIDKALKMALNSFKQLLSIPGSLFSIDHSGKDNAILGLYRAL